MTGSLYRQTVHLSVSSVKWVICDQSEVLLTFLVPFQTFHRVPNVSSRSFVSSLDRFCTREDRATSQGTTFSARFAILVFTETGTTVASSAPIIKGSIWHIQESERGVLPVMQWASPRARTEWPQEDAEHTAFIMTQMLPIKFQEHLQVTQSHDKTDFPHEPCPE